MLAIVYFIDIHWGTERGISAVFMYEDAIKVNTDFKSYSGGFEKMQRLLAQVAQGQRITSKSACILVHKKYQSLESSAE
jgi:hypothetical protein